MTREPREDRVLGRRARSTRPRDASAKSRLAMLLVVGAFARSSTAQAAGIADAPLRPEDRVAATLSTTGTASPQTAAVKTVALVPALAGAYRLSRRFVLSADVALSMTSYRFADQDRGGVARLANPVLGLQVTALETPSLRLWIGAAAGAPLVTVPGGITRNAAAEHADRAATAATGQRLYWLWARNAAPLVAFARLEYAIEELVVRVDLEPGLLLSVNRDPSAVAMLGAFEPAMRLGAWSPGVRLTSLFRSRALDTDDFSQSTIAAFLRWQGAHLLGAVEAVTGIDGPQGVGRDAQTSWGATLIVGARF